MHPSVPLPDRDCNKGIAADGKMSPACLQRLPESHMSQVYICNPHRWDRMSLWRAFESKIQQKQPQAKTVSATVATSWDTRWERAYDGRLLRRSDVTEAYVSNCGG